MSHYINLYDPGLLQRREWLTAANLAFASVAILFVMLLWGGWAHIDASRLSAQAASLDNELRIARETSVTLSNQLAARRADPKMALDIAALRELLGVREQIRDALGQGIAGAQIGYADYLRGLARQSLPDLWLTGFAVGTDGARMEIRGRTLDPALLPEYIRRLNAEPAFRGRRFAALSVAVPAPAPGANGQAATTPPWHEFALVPEQSGTATGGRQ